MGRVLLILGVLRQEGKEFVADSLLENGFQSTYLPKPP
jgi:hypothetical protein